MADYKINIGAFQSDAADATWRNNIGVSQTDPPSFAATDIIIAGQGSVTVSDFSVSVTIDDPVKVEGAGSVAIPSINITNTERIAHIMEATPTIIIPGWDVGCNQGSGDVWSSQKPTLVNPLIGAGSLEQIDASPMDRNSFNGGGFVDAEEYHWYEDCHLLPRLMQELGNLVSEQIINCDFYNTDRNEDITISSITNNLGYGIEVSGVPAAPFVVKSQESLVFTLTIKTVGDLTIDASYTLHRESGETYTIYITGSRIVLFPYRPEAPLREHLLFDTRIIEKVDGSEQRIANRQYPRTMFEATYKHGQQYIEMLLFDRQAKIVAYPAWHEPAFVTGAVSAGAVTVNVNTTNYANFYVGGYAVVIDDENTYDALKIESMTATSLTFTSETSHNFSVKAQVMPLLTSYIEASSAAIKYAANQEYFNLRIHVDPEVNDIASAAAWNSYASGPFMDGPNLMEGGQLAEAIRTKVLVLDNLTGLRTQETSWDHAKRFGKKGWKTNTRQELWELRQLLHYLKGKQVGFYIPTFWEDLTITQNMQVGTFVVNIKNIGYVVNAQNRWPKSTIRIHFTDDTILTRVIQNSAVVSDTEEQLTLDASWPSSYTPDDIKRVEFLEKVRLDVDDITIIHYNALGQAECIVPLKEIDN